MTIKDIETALEGAAYHERRAFELADPTGMTEERYRAVVIHLHGYYWELWSAWDYLLHIANGHTVQQRDVNTRILDAIAGSHPAYQHLQYLQQIRSSPELARIGRLRHSAHRMVLAPYQVEVTDIGVSVISLRMQDGHQPVQVNVDGNDLGFVRQVVEHLKSTGFF